MIDFWFTLQLTNTTNILEENCSWSKSSVPPNPNRYRLAKKLTHCAQAVPPKFARVRSLLSSAQMPIVVQRIDTLARLPERFSSRSSLRICPSSCKRLNLLQLKPSKSWKRTALLPYKLPTRRWRSEFVSFTRSFMHVWLLGSKSNQLLHSQNLHQKLLQFNLFNSPDSLIGILGKMCLWISKLRNSSFCNKLSKRDFFTTSRTFIQQCSPNWINTTSV